MSEYGSNYDYGNSPLYKDDGDDITSDNLFIFFPNWKNPVYINYKMETVISKTKYGLEQRKTLLTKPILSQKYTLSENIEYTKIWNFIQSLQSSTFYSLLHTEVVKITDRDSLLGLLEVNTNNLQYHYYLNNYSTYCLLYDNRKIIGNLILEIDTVNSDSIKFKSAISSRFMGQNTYIYPIYFCFISDKSRKDTTDKYTEISVELTEINEISEYITARNES